MKKGAKGKVEEAGGGQIFILDQNVGKRGSDQGN